jgi:hypothetical protein
LSPPSDNLSSPNDPESSAATPGIALVLLDPGMLFVPRPAGSAPRESCAPLLANRDLLVLGEEERTEAAVVVVPAGDGKVAARTGEPTSLSLLFSLLFAGIVTDVIHGGMRLLYKMGGTGGRGRKGR